MKIDSLAASQLYGSVQNSLGAKASADKVEGPNFADALESALAEMRRNLQVGETTSVSAMSGQGDVQSLVEALTATEMALETAVTVRDRVVEAYQEILRMPV
ncbi:MAG: flagellar hook-basal body complex protein FliE [Pseudomonadota bacterium]